MTIPTTYVSYDTLLHIFVFRICTSMMYVPQSYTIIPYVRVWFITENAFSIYVHQTKSLHFEKNLLLVPGQWTIYYLLTVPI